ncbi:hypothetical protein J6590_024125 [Homalodisca vitripennis]|nr:hypothetical protein J6590_024125 [Homalodisca vitripennis]
MIVRLFVRDRKTPKIISRGTTFHERPDDENQVNCRLITLHKARFRGWRNDRAGAMIVRLFVRDRKTPKIISRGTTFHERPDDENQVNYRLITLHKARFRGWRNDRETICTRSR